MEALFNAASWILGSLGPQRLALAASGSHPLCTCEPPGHGAANVQGRDAHTVELQIESTRSGPTDPATRDSGTFTRDVANGLIRITGSGAVSWSKSFLRV